ncbi:dTDP-4-dehydrorhamnose reductase [bacterium]|nr:dTDP-4-dehydrorhamnose reductase [bacterium]
MPVAILGAGGMLGKDCVEIFEQTYDIVTFSKAELDITDPMAINTQLSQVVDLDVVINCAAYTNVDGAETHRDLAFLANETGPAYLAEWCGQRSVILVHFSTDYVFNGQGDTPYPETHAVAPINAYGASKLAGEMAIRAAAEQHYIFRIQWLYGQYGTHFVKTITELLRTKPQLSVVNDQIGALTWTRDIATTVKRALQRRIPYGTYHLAADGYASWHEVTCKIAEVLELTTPIVAVGSDTFHRPAQRPHNSRLDCNKLWKTGVSKIPRWDEQLSHFLQLI